MAGASSLSGSQVAVAIAAGFAMAYNIRHYEPIEGEGGRPDRLEGVSQWALLGASMVNISSVVCFSFSLGRCKELLSAMLSSSRALLLLEVEERRFRREP